MENKRGKNDKVFREVWKIVDAKAKKIRMTKIKREKSKRKKNKRRGRRRIKRK